MRSVLIFIVLAGVVGCQPAEEPAPTESTESPMVPASLNAVDVEPDISIVEFENDLVRVVRTRRPAGHKSPMHTHLPGVYVSLNEDTLGEIGNTFENAGEEHETENTGDTERHGVMVELKVDSGTAVEAPSHDAVVVDPEHHTVEFENELVRVVRMTYPEGYATPSHNHYAGVNILLTDIRVTSGPEGEELEPAENEAGYAAWAETGEPHITTNLGGEMQLIRVELKIQ